MESTALAWNHPFVILTDSLGEIDFDLDEIQFLARSATAISGDDLAMFEKFLDMLNDLDDVQNVYHDAEF